MRRAWGNAENAEFVQQIAKMRAYQEPTEGELYASCEAF